jgi:hypothetical protein
MVHGRFRMNRQLRGSGGRRIPKHLERGNKISKTQQGPLEASRLLFPRRATSAEYYVP